VPKKLKVNANQRVDISDFERAANDYTAESVGFNTERMVLDARSRVFDGFRVEIADQTTNQGQVTVYNGNAFDRNGTHLNNEDLANTAKTVTLAGASTTFYLEAEFVETDSDTDARAFWDPTFDQVSPIPDGQEFNLNVATRISPDWQIVTPVSTTGFDVDSDPDSLKIPLMELSTNGNNEIVVGVNPGLVTVFASSVLLEDGAVSDTVLRVSDARIFPDSGTVDVDVGDASVESGKTITNVDRDNGLITISPALSSIHDAGAIVRVSSGVARFVRERTNGLPTPTTHPDNTRRLWQGDEIRGSGLIRSKETFGSRDDLNLRSLKDYVDILAAEIRELKFGDPRTDIVSADPPDAFSSAPRWFDPAGGVAGARAATVTIGDGTNTFGDYNGTDEEPFFDAIAELSSRGGGRLIIKEGTYTFTDLVTITDEIEIIGVGQNIVTLVNNTATGPMLSFNLGGIDEEVYLHGFTIQVGTGDVDAVDLADVGLICDNVDFLCQIDGVSATNKIVANACRFEAPSGICINITSTLIDSSFVNCSFDSSSAVGIDAVNIFSTSFIRCTFDNTTCFTVGSTAQRIHFSNCIFTPTVNLVDVGNATLLTFSECWASGDVTTNALFDFTGAASDIHIRNCFFSTTFTGSTTGTPGRLVDFGANITDCSITNNTLAVSGAGVTNGVQISSSTATVDNLNISGCKFESFFRGVYVPGGTAASGTFSVVNCSFDGDSASHSQHALRIDDGAFSFTFSGNDVFGLDTGAVTKRGVTVTSTAAATNAFAKITENRFRDIGSSSATEAAAIHIDRSNSTGSLSGVISGNEIVLVETTTGVQVYGIRVVGNPLVLSTKIVISDNVIEEISGTTALTTGIYVFELQNVSIHGNIISKNVNTSGVGSVASIYVDSCAGVCSDNQIQLPRVGGAASTQAGIYVETTTPFVVSGNSLWAEGTAPRSDVAYGIQAEISTAVSLSITDNTVRMNLDTLKGIYCTTGTGNVKNLSIDNNRINNMSQTTTACVGIDLTLDDDAINISVCGNTVEEENFAVNHAGIVITGGSSAAQNVRVNNNNLRMDRTGGPATRTSGGVGQAIYMIQCDIASCSNNIVSWTQASPLVGGNAIHLNNCDIASVVGNIVLPNNSATGDEILVDGTSSGGFVVSNLVGISGVAGTISTSGASDYDQVDTPTGDNLNKIS
jgi:hypothetical protein